MTFIVLEGKDKGSVFRALPLPVTVGREEGNTLRLDDERASRFHAKVQAESGEIIITDLDSTNGTRVNGAAVQIRRLRPGDQVGIGRSLLLFGTTAEIAAQQQAPVLAAFGANQLRVVSGNADDLPGNCALLRATLSSGSAICTGALAEALCGALTEDSPARAVLGSGFHRVVVIDVSPIATTASTPQERFMVEVCRAVGAAFGLELFPDRFHSEDVFQVLKDEPPSLFCFTHFDQVPVECFALARAFTQSQHRALLLNPGARDIAVEERRAAPEESHFAEAVQHVRAAKISSSVDGAPPLPEQLSPAQAARLAEMLDFLHRGITSAIEHVEANDDGTQACLGLIEWQSLLAVQFALARYARRVAEPDARD